MKVSEWFVTGKRDNGDSFVSLKDGRPDWLQEAVHEAHGGNLPDDWIYAECEAACEAIDNGDLKDEDALHEHADGRVDVYTKARFEWAAQFCLTDLYSTAEGEAEEMGDTSDVTEKLGLIQYHAIYHIAATMLQAVAEATDEEDAAE
jgi:hypothetical protein